MPSATCRTEGRQARRGELQRDIDRDGGVSQGTDADQIRAGFGIAAIDDSVMPPESSTSGRRASPRSGKRASASRTCATDMLSKRSTSAPMASASMICSVLVTSTSMRTLCGALADGADRSSYAPRLPRCGCPDQHTRAEISAVVVGAAVSHRPLVEKAKAGRVLRVSTKRVSVPASASTYLRVWVAMPDRRCRRSTVRSAASRPHRPFDAHDRGAGQQERFHRDTAAGVNATIDAGKHALRDIETRQTERAWRQGAGGDGVVAEDGLAGQIAAPQIFVEGQVNQAQDSGGGSGGRAAA